MADQLHIREAYHIQKKSMRQIAREQGHSRNTVKKAVVEKAPFEYKRKGPAPAPVLGPYKERLRGLPQRIIYDNLKPAVKHILKGRNRQEQDL